MTHHCTHPKIDPDYPATLSKKVLGIIRKEGFDGVIFTDSLAMMGILQKYGEGPAMGLAFNAGSDVILPNYRTPISEVIRMMKENFENGMFTEERLDEAVRRILTIMEFVEAKKNVIPEMTEQDVENLKNITRDCITAVTDEGVPASLGDKEKRRLFVIVTDNNFSVDTPDMEISETRWYKPNVIAQKVKSEFPNSDVTFIPEFATPGQNEKILLAATKHDEVVFITYCASACYLGTDCMTRRTENLINCLIMSGKVSAVLHYGNPHAVEPLQHVKRVIFGYNSPASLEPAIDVLAGNIEAKGKLPIKVDLQ
jgi:beta-N-acetylhexosaminidase